jgi:hypothetical protein
MMRRWRQRVGVRYKNASMLVNSLKQKHFSAEVRNVSELKSITYEVRRFHPWLIDHTINIRSGG